MIKFRVADSHLESHPDGCMITGIFEESHLFPSTKKIDNISGGYISSLLHRGAFQGKMEQTLLLYDIPQLYNRQILLIGCGKKYNFDEYCYRKLIRKIILLCKEIPIVKILFFLSELKIKGYDNYWKIRQTIEIVEEELYVFNKFKNNKNKSNQSLKEIILHIPNTNELTYCKQSIKDGLSIVHGIKIAKDLGNMPPNFCTPDYLIDQVNKLSSRNNITINIIDALEMKKLGMNAYLAVGLGSSYTPKMPIIKYEGHPEGSNVPPIIFIGKGLTFDSGGISIKASNKMDEMKYDMCGAAAVYAVMCIATELNLPLNIIGILAISENMVSHTSFRPGDILTTLSGQTVEILNTDAEGRLVLCDALTYAERYKPDVVIDIATLTGACVVALGHHFSGLMSNNEDLANDLIIASKQSKDYVWRLPLNDIFQKQLKSTCADMTNVGGKSGGAITAGCFLQKFAHKYHWAHLDIAGTAWRSNDCDKSATGRPVALLSQYLMNRSFSHKNKQTLF
ncbi:leucyl aminopeptidase [Candidatus Blochmannia vicinus (nom. nud.)]|uniref:leucyl aminopeptidase n=1 Tax=Candidatus Blochmannia vicinus (nom. nud.) TaxID=251540 RepID=UPI00202563CA|nr:leucyl aminopeptidase [Candidatus Blochmannia vicinus]URJ30594.1 leucyl aminopeptidase [Candidatus Blochmannia vicinus]